MKNKFYKFTASKDKTQPARLDLFGSVGGGFWDNGFDENSFKQDMEAVAENQDLNIYINTNGGSVFTAICIYNILSRHKGNITITVAGISASAGTIITSVPNAKVIMPLGSLMLVHPVRVSADSMTPKELKEASENLEKVRKSVRDIYVKKTGLSEAKLDELMDNESYLTASEAVELGFADEVDDTNSVKNVMEGKYINFNGMRITASLFDKLPVGLLSSQAETNTIQNCSKEDEKMDLEKLKAEYPDLVEAIRKEGYQSGVQAERERMQSIDAVAMEGFSDLVAQAKYENGQTAEQLAVAILKAQKERAHAQLEARAKDAETLADIGASGNLGETAKAEAQAQADLERNAIIQAGARGFSY